ncbi:MAG: class I SAM-dependent methyltransferase [Syntrophomonadaceae bacterium]
MDKYKVKSALDCACGTGPHLRLLARMDIEVYGSDLSEAMLKVCRPHLARASIHAITRQADYRCLEQAWNRHFDAILCMNQSIAHMHTREDLLTAFRSMHTCLNDHGILIMTQGTTHHNLKEGPRFDLVTNKRDFSRIFVRDLEDGFQTYHYLDVYHSARRDEMVTRTVRLKIILDDEYRQLLGEAGFSRVHIYGGFDMAPYDRERSRRLIVVAEKWPAKGGL